MYSEEKEKENAHIGAKIGKDFNDTADSKQLKNNGVYSYVYLLLATQLAYLDWMRFLHIPFVFVSYCISIKPTNQHLFRP